ncbi:PHP domain-containing protein [Arthrobacter sp. TES]|uniref:PHP domain-containing protein n=1 Tax=Paenarthrobacter TaxID=1742992 RepID=UPI0003976BB6|nr:MULTISPECIES: PHP domain-containing protein [Paenarthrobacter]AOY70476.1 metal-dependent phosphoesterase [Arthrobacter sp. ZXY-2]ERI38199.1 metal-dependent phosphoesterase [Arthrobacter sp. AK-YN10]QOI62689.1 PHP domain-containing protein [Arthrobacter sp. TES]QSZ53373.1 metal-dependent phosphoesterase [Paenarthrobacter ureafaciens]WOC59796.1 PHP domain-containing protein [Paenarthrobacter sp. AT5]
MRIDLHTHSNVSDGTETPAEVIRSAAKAGLDAVALTDHDSTDGWDQAAEAAVQQGLAFVPGMEISCRTDKGISVHLLSYLHDPTHPGLLEEINKSRDARLTRAERMVTLLSEDYPLTWDDVIHHVAPGATVGRPHIADALVAAGVVADRSEAFNSILTSHSRYFIQHYAPDPALAVGLVRAAGGVPVFAHPVASSRGRIVGDKTYREMIDAGLLGLEIDHRDNPEEGRKFLRDLAAEHGLLITGSSDYHGTGKPNLLGENLTDPAVLERIEELGTGSTVVR